MVVRRTRRLPIKGEVLVVVGQEVSPSDVVARALLPGPLQTVRLAEKLGVEANEIKSCCKLAEGDAVQAGQVVAETKGMFGLFKSAIPCEYTGVVESISEISGHMLVREAPVPVDVRAYLQGRIAEVIEAEGAVVEAHGAMVQGIFGIGGEREGEVRVAVTDPQQALEASMLMPSDAGKIVVGGSQIGYEAIERGASIGVAGLIAGGVRDVDLVRFLGYDIGVAITGQEAIGLSLMVTEGFGPLEMAGRTFELLKTLEGKRGSMNGATQIRAGVIRPELIVPQEVHSGIAHAAQAALELMVGTPIRVIREPYFGRLGAVTELPAQLQVVDSGTEVRVLKARLESGEEVMVPRANVEILAS